MIKEPILNQRVRITQYSTNPDEFVGMTGKIVEINGSMLYVEVEDEAFCNKYYGTLLLYTDEVESLD